MRGIRDEHTATPPCPARRRSPRPAGRPGRDRPPAGSTATAKGSGMKRYATYRRVSEITATNIEGSMNDQRDRCQGHIRQSDGVFIRDYEEAGKSAYNEKNLDKRTAYQQMLKDA